MACESGNAAIVFVVLLLHGLFMWVASRGLELTSEPSHPIEVSWEEPQPPVPPAAPAQVPDAPAMPLPVSVPYVAPPPEVPVVEAAADPGMPADAPAAVASEPPVGPVAIEAPPSSAGSQEDEPGSVAEAIAQEADYLANPAPDYPLGSRLLGEEGRVLVRALVDAQGLPLEVSLGTSCGHGRLDRSALATVRRWKFRPAQIGGAARSGWVVIPIRFSLRRT